MNILQWAGGKTSLLNVLQSEIPSNFNDYYEPFLGSGVFFKRLYDLNLLKNDSYLSDLNMDSINVFKQIQNSNNLSFLMYELSKLNNCANQNDYLSVRKKFNQKRFNGIYDIENAAFMIYLNRMGFNGLYRVNSKNHYNVPYGKKKKFNYPDLNVFQDWSNALKNSILLNNDFKTQLMNCKKGDFIYLDPPYADPNNKTFTSYNKIKFDFNDQLELIEILKRLDKIGCYFMVSNNNNNILIDEYKKSGLNLNIKTVLAKRSLNSDIKNRKKTEEVIIKNY